MAMPSEVQSGGAGSPGLLQETNSEVATRVNKEIEIRWIRFMQPLLTVVAISQAGNGKQAASNLPLRA